jgi:hypothetical protein
MNYKHHNDMNFLLKGLISIAFIWQATAQAQLVVTVSPPNIAGQKAIVKLTIKNNLTNKVESARAVCFLLDKQGEMVGQITKWVAETHRVSIARAS